MSLLTPLNKSDDNDNWVLTIFISLKQTYNHFDTYLFNKCESTHPCGEAVEEHTLSDFKNSLTLTFCVLFAWKV